MHTTISPSSEYSGSEFLLLDNLLSELHDASIRYHQKYGRGILFVDFVQLNNQLQAQPTKLNLPVDYLPQAHVPLDQFPDAFDKLRTYDPTWQLVVALEYPDHLSIHQLGYPKLMKD